MRERIKNRYFELITTIHREAYRLKRVFITSTMHLEIEEGHLTAKQIIASFLIDTRVSLCT